MPIDNPDKTIELKYPVTVKGQKYTEIGLRRPKVKDLRHISGPKASDDATKAQSAFLSAISEIIPEVFDELDLEDAEQFNKVVAAFLNPKDPD